MKKYIIILIIVIAIITTALVVRNYAWATDTGATSPGTAVNNGTGTDWTNPNNILVSNDTYATYYASLPGSAGVDCLDWEVKIVKSDDTIGTTDKKETDVVWGNSDAYTIYGGASDLWGETWTANDINNSNFGIVLKVRLRDNGDLSYYNTSKYIKVTNFGFSIPTDNTINGIKAEIEKKAITNTTDGTAYVDHIRITVYYTEAGRQATQIKTGIKINAGKLIIK